MPMALTSLGIFYPLIIQHKLTLVLIFIFFTFKNIGFFVKPSPLSTKLGVPRLVHPRMCQDLMRILIKLVECMEHDGPQHYRINPKNEDTQKTRPNNYNKGPWNKQKWNKTHYQKQEQVASVRTCKEKGEKRHVDGQMFKLNFMVTWQRTTNPSPLR
jgi:hypothetical protein